MSWCSGLHSCTARRRVTQPPQPLTLSRSRGCVQQAAPQDAIPPKYHRDIRFSVMVQGLCRRPMSLQLQPPSSSGRAPSLSSLGPSLSSFESSSARRSCGLSALWPAGVTAVSSLWLVYRTRLTSLIFKHSDKALRHGQGTLDSSSIAHTHATECVCVRS